MKQAGYKKSTFEITAEILTTIFDLRFNKGMTHGAIRDQLGLNNRNYQKCKNALEVRVQSAIKKDV